ncbi:DUF4202 domain-containing protein [Sulfurirhabdus autotrophica]|uniref:Uncharacterized protein DUF4202 n=1 Tax=Sulfurirhabdus autotrophica TaxID=1706046 RepID=A0A4R3YAL2_9PROT|nr:DUF4202 domain-containing protein [Sulfurirhabdus autotrophica]TCV88986.1 uncharacterized protein DUF4202 [Sulfurirhabdus autotrophica]
MTTNTTERFAQAIAGFDAANAEDPNKEISEGAEHPKELLYAQRMSAMLKRFAPEASEAVQLAVRCQHIQRWKSARTDYPATPEGYKKWRTDLQKFHAETAGNIMREAGYDDEMITRVQSLLRKEGLKRNPETQLLEDVVDLVFLEYYMDDFVKKYSHYDEAKWIDIIQKTWRKMSPEGHKFALTLNLPPAHVPLILKAVG